ncbi:hypothetical protein CARUB_v10007041mg [Capsella rubella]|uniref:F-box domain-containing protein n=1 Tax=Capsella rubella TaxID=81985 RepID=R0H1L1_9BRAS|nr:F-box/kelch-repeat protein At4g19865 [Capsella rubella]EOA18490.1 hypothetical protein CARUB_v10007041mg [Capsella rubella]
MNSQVEPPEKRKRKRKRTRTRKRTSKKKTTNMSPSYSSPCPSFSSLPDEILVDCLARISSSYYPTLSIVSKSFRSIISSADLKAARSHIGNTEQWLYVCLYDSSFHIHQWYRLLLNNPNRTRPDSMIKKNNKTTGQLLVPVTFNYSSNLPTVSESTIAVGSEIYVIGGPVDYAPSSAVRVIDCCSNTWRDAPSMNVARNNAATCFHHGKIYVMGGCQGSEDESWAEVLDTKTQTWERLTDPGTEIRKSPINGIREIEGKIKFGGLDDKVYCYDTKQCGWEHCVNEMAIFSKSECVMGNISYGFWNMRLLWCDIMNGYWEEVEGLDALVEMYMRNGSSSGFTTKLIGCGGKLLVIWQGYMSHDLDDTKKIWCAEIAIVKRYEGQLWGIVEKVDDLRTVTESCQLLHCLVVSV